MGQIFQTIHDIQDIRLSDARMAAMFEVFDDLHTAASEGQLEAITSLNKRELVGWLRELVFTAQETISEIESAKIGAQPAIHLVK